MNVLFPPETEFARMTLTRIFFLTLAVVAAAPNSHAVSDDFGDTVVYGVHHALNLGGSGERPKTDYFINMGARHGISRGDFIEARRNTPSYDLLNRRLYKDMSFPIARLRIIHVERSMAVARLARILPADDTPTITPAAVMIGDSVRRLNDSESKKERALTLAATVGRKRVPAQAGATGALGAKVTPSQAVPPTPSAVGGVVLSPTPPVATRQ